LAWAEPPTILDQEAGEKPEDPAVGPAGEKPAGSKTPGDKKPAGEPAAEPGATDAASLLDEMDPGAGGQPAWDIPPAPAAPTYPYVEYHGYFRLRPDLISNGHLGIAVADKTKNERIITTSAILPPLSLWPANNDPGVNSASSKVGKDRDETVIAGANMRLRLTPTFHLADTIRIQTSLDIFDNYVLGSRPDYAGAVVRPDVPLVAFATSTQPGTIAVKEVYGEWKTLLGLLRVGRQGSQWGLGILADAGAGTGWDGGRPTEYYGGTRLPHEGSGHDADFGSYADRIAFLTKVGPLYVSYFYDFVSEGIVGYDPTRVDGQARDLVQSDDVKQHGLVILSKPLSAQEIDARKTLLLDDHKPALDWGLYLVYRSQDLDLQGQTPPSQQDQADAAKVQLMVRDAWAGIGDAWVRYEQRLAFAKRLVIEAEFAFVQGKIADANTNSGTAAKERDLQLWGGALKAAWQNEGFGIFLDAGAASGDDTGCFGVTGDGNCSLSTVAGEANSAITGFKFHRNYRVGALLFRDVIGAVTNTYYVRPTVSINAYPFYAAQQLGVDLSILYAGAMQAEGTPGGGSSLGTELEARGFLGQKGLFQAWVSFAYLLPGDAFDLKAGWNDASEAAKAEGAWRVMSNLSLLF